MMRWGSGRRARARGNEYVEAAVRAAVIFVRKCREELVEMQNMILSKKDVITRLSTELNETRGRMLDLRGG